MNLKLLRAKIELKIHEIEDKLLDFSSKASLSSSLTLSNFQENNGSNSEAAKAQLTLSIPCMMEGKALMRKHSSATEIYPKKRNIRVYKNTTLRFNPSVFKREVFRSSLAGVKEEIRNFEAKLKNLMKGKHLDRPLFRIFKNQR